jgi:hypothetical protein
VGDGVGEGVGEEDVFDGVGDALAGDDSDGAGGGGVNPGGGDGVGEAFFDGLGLGAAGDEDDGDGGESETCCTSAAGRLGAGALLFRLVTARAVPAPAIAITTMATAAALTTLTRRNSGIRSTVKPVTSGGPPRGHNAASSNAASPRCDRPRFSQSGP